MPRRRSNTGIPGLSFSWRRAAGISQGPVPPRRQLYARTFLNCIFCLILVMTLLTKW